DEAKSGRWTDADNDKMLKIVTEKCNLSSVDLKPEFPRKTQNSIWSKYKRARTEVEKAEALEKIAALETENEKIAALETENEKLKKEIEELKERLRTQEIKNATHYGRNGFQKMMSEMLEENKVQEIEEAKKRKDAMELK
ncbi:hypothetical protein A2U01_0049200, partial [Trifolium medium]|nr:hypothetical protein [Trifolium medium]